MKRLDYLLQGFLKGLYKDAFFVKSCMSLFTSDATEDYLVRKDDKGYYYLQDGQAVYFEDGQDTTRPLIDFREKIVVPAGTLPNHPDELVTSCGNLLQNFLLTIGPFGSRVPYINKRFKPNDVFDEMTIHWTRPKTQVTEENPAREGEIFTEEFLEFTNNALFLSNFESMVVPSITTKALSKNPLLEKRKKELLSEFQGNLNNPAVLAKIDDELKRIDKEYLKDDPSAGFLIDGKDFDVVRKKMFYYFGITTGLNGEPVFVEKPLSEGIEMENLHVYANDAYSGSIGRGLDTQEGGVAVNNSLRSAISLRVDLEVEDCGSKFGEPITLPSKEKDARHYLNYAYMDGGVTKRLTLESIPALLGKTLNMRTPSTCTLDNGRFCKTCVQPNILAYPDGLMTVNAIPGSRIMAISMKAMHGKALSVVELDLPTLFS